MFQALLLFSLLSISFAEEETYVQNIRVKQVYQFTPGFTAVENLAVRSNGGILLNTVTGPNTYFIDPTEPNPTPILIATYTGCTSTTGIAEVFPDVFAVVCGNYTVQTKQGVPGSFSVWTVNIKKPGSPVVKKVTAIPAAQALNGMTDLGADSPGLVLIADSKLGAVWAVNVITGSYQIAISDPLVKTTDTFPLGINGLHARGNLLYFTNSAQGLFASIRINNFGRPQGPAQVIARPFSSTFPGYPVNIFDDFAIDEDGKAWITNHPNSITTVNKGGVQNTVSGGSALVQPTSCAFGRGSRDEKCKLYVTTAGTVYNASYIVSGSLVVLDVC
jgi:sugar lactone lactonase YvrE